MKILDLNIRSRYNIHLISFLLCSFFLNCLHVVAQNNHITDSLLTVLQQENLSKREQALVLKAIVSNHPELDSGSQYANQFLQIAIEINDPILQAEAWEEIWHIEDRLGNSSQSLNAALKALRIYEKLNLTERQGASYAQIAAHYVGEKEYTSAITYFKRADSIYTKSKNTIQKALTLINLGETYRLSNHLDDAKASFIEVINLNKVIQNNLIQGYAVGNLGMVYTTQNEFILAKDNLHEAINILNKLGDSYSTSIYLAELGGIHQKENESKFAEEKFLQALTMAKQAGLKEQIRDFSIMLVNFYETQQQYPRALEYQKLFQVYQDSLVNKENVQKIEQLKSGYEIDKRESEISLLNTINTNQKNLVFILAAGVFLLLFFAYLLYRGNTKIKKANYILLDQKEIISKREQEKALLLKELNHRVKNNLQMVSSLLNLQGHELTGHPAKEAIVSGQSRVEALSLVHRKLYQDGVDTRIMIKEYIEELVLGLFHGYNAKFKPNFDIANISIHIDMAIPLALIINELITNSLKYAYENTTDPMLKVALTNDTKDRLHIQVIDNGVGFTTIQTKKNNSFGIKLINSLIQQLEGTIKKTGNEGTHWEIDIKIA
ncbi:tetratricopeptide repeat-containing sensor histidine kinase [Aquimarina algiphila]|uniref:tetratricopeptide repeat-containing sensor histidine kinase n=1 Tax=Aquimarina algiphila TaxID=2047982 RepID=UPI00232BC663|nr:histidine kinase dimerization/phosphoacceptor domain -containing protein [Aquimarina algiphila]